jgi:hypothetical protein
MNKIPQYLVEMIMKSHGGLIKQVKQQEHETKVKQLNQLRQLSNKANNK